MPAKNSRKEYLENGCYHIYNRGVEKRKIFLDKQDYGVFLSYLKDYLLPKDIDRLREKLANPETSYKEKDRILKELRLNNFSDSISLFAYCLMQNHFHLLVKQADVNTIDLFINSLGTRYSMYFNRKYKRVGHLFQGVYKAALISNDEYLLELSRYIHFQAIEKYLTNNNQPIQPSSYTDYLGLTKTAWIKPELILSFFSKSNPKFSYKTFTERTHDFQVPSDIILD